MSKNWNNRRYNMCNEEGGEERKEWKISPKLMSSPNHKQIQEAQGTPSKINGP